MSETYISIEGAAELTGYSASYLRKLAGRRGLVSWSEVKRLASSYKPFWVTLPDSALKAESPDPALLLHRPDLARQTLPFAAFLDRVEVGHCLDWLRQMPAGIVQAVVTSPPYWGVRKYPGETAARWADGSVIALGEEPTIEQYAAHSLEVLRHLKRVLKPDGVIWWNIGDTYQTRAYLRASSSERLRAIEGDRRDVWREYPHKRYSAGHAYLKDKDLTLAPFLVAMGAQRIGLYVRAIIIWHKDNAGLDSAKDRPAATHEYLILMAKSRFYKYFAENEREEAVTRAVIDRKNGHLVDRRNLRTVWKFPPGNRDSNHVAAFPPELPRRCLRPSLRSQPEPGDLVLDPFAGSGTTLKEAKALDRRYFGCDILSDFVVEAKSRLQEMKN